MWCFIAKYWIKRPPVPVRTIPVVPVSQTTGYEKNLISLKTAYIANFADTKRFMLTPRSAASNASF